MRVTRCAGRRRAKSRPRCPSLPPGPPDGLGSFTLSAAAAFDICIELPASDESFNHATIFGGSWNPPDAASFALPENLVLPGVCRCYACLLCYMALSTVWTPDPRIAVNTLLPGLNFLLLLMLFGSLVMFHHVAAVLLSGHALRFFLVARACTPFLTGFPLTRPPDFSYNAIAGM